MENTIITENGAGVDNKDGFNGVSNDDGFSEKANSDDIEGKQSRDVDDGIVPDMASDVSVNNGMGWFHT